MYMHVKILAFITYNIDIFSVNQTFFILSFDLKNFNQQHPPPKKKKKTCTVIRLLVAKRMCISLEF